MSQCCLEAGGQCPQHADMQAWPVERGSSYWTFDRRLVQANERFAAQEGIGRAA